MNVLLYVRFVKNLHTNYRHFEFVEKTGSVLLPWIHDWLACVAMVTMRVAGGMRRGSGGSLDSGMASTSSGSNGSREIPTNGKQPGGKPTGGERADGGNSSRFNLFGKKAKTSKTSVAGVPSNMSEV